jgi:hypothetical protein
MSIERLVTCACGPCMDEHDVAGCSGGTRASSFERSRLGCSCRHTRRSALEALLDFERQTIHQEWRTPNGG